MNKILLEQFQSRPIPQTETSVFIDLDNEDSTFIVDKRNDYETTTYDALINNMKFLNITKSKSKTLHETTKKPIHVNIKHSFNVSETFIVIG